MSPSSLPRIGFIGAGRLACCLARGLARAGYPVAAIASRSVASAHDLAAEFAGCLSSDDPQTVVAASDIVFLTVPDDSIGTTANTLRFGAAAGGASALVHCSGASPVELLEPARAQGAATGGFHPLYLFSGDPVDVERIVGCSVTIEADGALRDALTAMAAALGCHPLSIPAGGRMLYHAAANYGASFVLAGLLECATLWRTLGFAEDDALRAVLPMLAGTIDTARERGLSGALAGPISRGDAGIVRRQLALLETLGADHAALYALMSRRGVELARRRPSPPTGLDAIAESVDGALARLLNPTAAGASAK